MKIKWDYEDKCPIICIPSTPDIPVVLGICIDNGECDISMLNRNDAELLRDFLNNMLGDTDD